MKYCVELATVIEVEAPNETEAEIIACDEINSTMDYVAFVTNILEKYEEDENNV